MQDVIQDNILAYMVTICIYILYVAIIQVCDYHLGVITI